MPDQVQIQNSSDLILVAKALAEKFDSANLLWRGHSNCNWKLTPSVFRGAKVHRDEVGIIDRFRVKARTRYANCPLNDDIPGWLFLMQHYGLPTRLLDWTESPLVAAFFAVNSNLDSDAALWALEPFKLNLIQTKEAVMYTQHDEPAKSMLQAAFDPKSDNTSKVVAIAPSEIDTRMLVQLSFSTVHGSSQPLESLELSDTFLRKFIIPHDAKPELNAELAILGMRLDVLFPDLEHLASYIKQKTYWF